MKLGFIFYFLNFLKWIIYSKNSLQKNAMFYLQNCDLYNFFKITKISNFQTKTQKKTMRILEF